MPRRAARVDDNQTEIVRASRDVGVSAQSLAAIGKGCPDLLLGVDGLTLVGRFNPEEVRRLLAHLDDLVIHDGANLLAEIKNPNVPKSDQALTAHEEKWEEN